MKIILNHTEEIIKQDAISITDLLAYKNFTFKMLVVKINGNFIPKDQYQRTLVGDGDDVVILHLMSGG